MSTLRVPHREQTRRSRHGNGGLAAVSLAHLGGIGIDPGPMPLHDTISRTQAAIALPSV
jgi:hypothetical protein